MAPKKKSTKQAPAPPKPTRMDIVLDPERQELIRKLCDETGLKANTKALFFAAEYYLNIKPLNEKKIKELGEENDLLKREIYHTKQTVNNFTNSFAEMQKLATADLPFTSGRINTNPVEESLMDKMNHSIKVSKEKMNAFLNELYCPNCQSTLSDDEIDNGYCDSCNNEFELLCPNCQWTLTSKDIENEICDSCDEPFDRTNLKPEKS